MPIGTASNRLRKAIIFNLLKQLGQNFCFQCGSEIESEKELSIEHKVPYLDCEDPVKLFFDLKNIAFSHLSCNCSASRRIKVEHGLRAYREGRCKCEMCTAQNTQKQRNFRSKQKGSVV